MIIVCRVHHYAVMFTWGKYKQNFVETKPFVNELFKVLASELYVQSSNETNSSKPEVRFCTKYYTLNLHVERW